MKYKNVFIEDISLFKHPLIFLELLIKVSIDSVISLKNLMLSNIVLVLAIAVVWGLLCTVQALSTFYAFFVFAFYWVILGVASSIGLGTGLHTFVLYLGPHIAKVAMIASSCGYLPQMIPNRWQFNHFAACDENKKVQAISFFGILLAVQLESILWGFGTALGELPPYFAAYKASKTRYELSKMQNLSLKKQKDDEKQKLIGGEQKQSDNKNSSNEIENIDVSAAQLENAEINEIQELKRKENPTLMDRAKIFIFDNMEKYGFITILLCASIPNPLFDLAGITCGHFRIPFRKFFIPTFIGKAIFKVHIQMLFVITIFRKQALETILGLMTSVSEKLSDMLKKGFQKQKEVLFHPADFDLDSKPILGRLWDLFLTIMIGYFLFSIVSGLVQQKAIQLKDQQNKK